MNIRTPLKVNTLSAHQLAKLGRIYSSKNWPIITEVGRDEFSDFCSMLECLENEERELVLSLTDSFLKVGIAEYIKNFLVAFDSMIHDLAQTDKKRIFLTPLLHPSNIGKPKSSIALYYQVKSLLHDLRMKHSQYRIFFMDNLSSAFDPKLAISDSDVICMIDDFIGTGETAIEVIDYMSNLGILNDSIIILSLVGQSIGVERIHKFAKVYVSLLRNRGISDLSDNVDDKIKIMLEIEQKMKVDKEFGLGYGASESLVKMVRTPNNTFPIYWFTKSKSIPKVPFPR